MYYISEFTVDFEWSMKTYTERYDNTLFFCLIYTTLLSKRKIILRIERMLSIGYFQESIQEFSTTQFLTLF